MSYEVDLNKNTRSSMYFGEVCKNFTTGVACAECDEAKRYYVQAKKESNTQVQDALKAKGRKLLAKSKIFINAIDTKDDEAGYPVKIYALPPTVYDMILANIKGVKQFDADLNPFHPETGCRIVIYREGQGIQTRYRVQIDQKPTPLPNMDALERMYNLSDVENILQENSQAFSVLAVGSNILRILPPWDDRKLIYKELKFHRFSVSQVNSEDEDQGVGVQFSQAGTANDGPVISKAAEAEDFLAGFSGTDTPDPNADVPMFDSSATGTDAQVDELIANARKLQESA